jgi:hypothetical protein
MENAIPSLQREIYNLGDKILGITGLSNIHKLMSIAIEMHCNEEIMYQRLQHIMKNPEHKNTYEMESIYPWKYYWNPDNIELMKFLSGCTEVTLGKAYTLSDMITMIMRVITHKIYDHKENMDVIINDLASYLDTDKENISLINGIRYQYPLTGSIIPATFEEAWIEKYPHEVKLTEEKYLEVYQPDWTVPMWCKPSLGPIPLGINPKRGQLNLVYSDGPGM